MKVLIPLFILSFCSLSLLAQKQAPPTSNWQLKDRRLDSVNGTSVNRAFAELLKGRTGQQVIVAVIDLGVDTAHPDLQGHIWTNSKEIPGNGIDDDHNGYVDDIHGWNYLGGKDGRNIVDESLETEREYYRLQPLYGHIVDSADARAKNLPDYKYWKDLADQRSKDSLQNVETVAMTLPSLSKGIAADSLLRLALKKDTVYQADIKAYDPKDSMMISIKNSTLAFLVSRHVPADISLGQYIGQGQQFLKRYQDALQNLHNDPFAQRRDIVKDDPSSIRDKGYGNNNIAAGYPDHGTHVSGIIAAIRGNNIGIEGITDNVKIMPVRAACNGDEMDKDVALAIRYAVDNGARIINMSFGKTLSPGKQWVDDALKYAASKNVLLIHGSGNDGLDIDSTTDFPTAYLNDGSKATNFLNIGATDHRSDSFLVARFSNYGATHVDLFAPGVDIYSLFPGNRYISESGTSMASPVVAGVAALVLEFYPKLSASQLAWVLIHSAEKYKGLLVRVPGGVARVAFDGLSTSGGIVNAYNALKLAATLKGERK